MRLVFSEEGDFEACNAAEAWCRNNGVSFGTAQRGSPRGLMRGVVEIGKWRTMTAREIKALDGTMEGDMRNGPVIIEIKDAASDVDAGDLDEVVG